MKGEDIAISSILCITSVGFLTVGTLRLIVFSLNAILQHKMHTLSTLSSTGNTATMTAELTQQIATLTQVVQVLNYTISGFLIGVGTINLSLTIYQIITKLYEINRLQNSKKICKLLEDHLKEIPMDTPGQQKLQFNQETTCYLHNLKQKSLFNSLGLNSLFLFFSSLNVLNGSFLLLALLGISFAVILSPIIGYGFGIFTALVAIPVALLVFREIRLKGRLNFATQTVQILKDALTKKGIELEHKQQQFLQIFLNNVNDSMGVAICSTEMKYYQSLLHKNHSFSGIESNLIQLHEVRTRALKHWKRLLSDPKTSAPLTQLVNEELARNHIRLKPETLTHPDATTYRNGVDVLLEAFHPGMLTNPTGTFLSTHTPPIYIEPFFYEWDIHLSNLFNYTFQIYNNMRRDLQDYRYLLHKKNLQNRYFNTPLSKQEISLLLERYNKRKRENRFTFRFSNFNKEIVALNTIQKPLSGKAPWDDHFMPELTQLMEYNRTFKDTITNLAKRGYEEPKLDLPEHSQVELLINYFLPVSWAN
jgi:hypothetical protein